MKSLSVASLLAFGLVCAQNESQAGFESSIIHGNSCFNATPGVQLNYSQWGPYNSSGNSGITVNCPLVLPDQAYTSIQFFVTGWSRSNTANKLSCTLATTGNTGGALATSTATVPYNANEARSANATTIPVPKISPYPYLTCYLSNILVLGFY
jgi:hypothetical protein